MATYAEQTQGGLSPVLMNQISTAVARAVRNDQRTASVNPGDKRKQEYLSGIQKEAALARALTTIFCRLYQ